MRTKLVLKSLKIIAFLLLPLLSLGQQEIKSNVAQQTEAREAAVSQVIQYYGKFLKDGNTDEILTLYHQDGEIIPDGSSSLIGTASIKNFYEQTFLTIKINGVLQIKEVKVYGNIAIVRCEEPAEVTLLADGSVEKTYFRELFILTLNSETSKWQIQKYMFSQNKSQS
ncbi:hypothetical protein [Sphingobacterium kitahiroshimense]|uniref:hypothetical protein n=1 Tax=Sphingobacterium kitahiroshimense TaxID=470446 RepID=UPI00320B7A0C